MPQTRRECEKLEAHPRLHRCDSEAGDPGLAFSFSLMRWVTATLHIRGLTLNTRGLSTLGQTGACTGWQRMVHVDSLGQKRRRERGGDAGPDRAGHRAPQGGADLGLQPQAGREELPSLSPAAP